MFEIAGGIIIAVIALVFFANVARYFQNKLALRKAHNLLALIASGTSDYSMDEENDLHEEVYKQLVLVQTKCKFAMNYVDELHDPNSDIADKAKERIDKTVISCLEIAQGVDDEFVSSSILHQISNLISMSGDFDKANGLIEMISVDFIQEQAKEFLIEQKKNQLIKI